MPLPPPVTTAVLPANSVMCTSLASGADRDTAHRLPLRRLGKRSVRAMSSRHARHHDPRASCSKKSTAPASAPARSVREGVAASWGGCILLPSMTPTPYGGIQRLLLGSRAALL